MSERPQTWHYGLVARWWAEFNEASEDELAFYSGFIEDSGQPALDAGCGTGRLLIPLLRAGFDIDGSDLSPDMLAHCREKAQRLGLHRRSMTRRCTSSICRADTVRSSAVGRLASAAN